MEIPSDGGGENFVVVALHDFVAQEQHHLSLRKGELITVITKDNSGWWIGRNNTGDVGIFPSTYAQRQTAAPPPAAMMHDITRAKLIRELGLRHMLQHQPGGLAIAANNEPSDGNPSSSDAESNNIDVDVDDLFGLEPADLVAERRKAEDECTALTAKANALFNEVVQQTEAAKNDDSVDSAKQRLTILQRRVEESDLERRLLEEEFQDVMADLRRSTKVSVPQCLLQTTEEAREAAPLRPASESEGPKPLSATALFASASANASPVQSQAASPKRKKSDTSLSFESSEDLQAVPKELEGLVKKTGNLAAARELSRLEAAINACFDDTEALQEGFSRQQQELAEMEQMAEQLAQGVVDAETLIAKGVEDSSSAEAEAQLATRKEELQRQEAAEEKAVQEIESGRSSLKLKVAEATAAYTNRAEEYEHLRAASGDLKKRNETLMEQVDALETELAVKQKQASEAELAYLQWKKTREEQSRSAVAEYKQLERKRREVYNKIQELRGNLRVYCRLKPCIGAEKPSGSLIPEDDMTLKVEERDEEGPTGRNATYEFDLILRPEATQEEVFQDVQPLATSVLDGYNVCIFAYGQTGSGKTYTMEGPPDNRGVNYRTVAELFRIALTERNEEYQYTLSVSILEVYNNAVFDLQSKRTQCKVRFGEEGVVVDPLVRTTVNSADDVQIALDRAYAQRSIGATDCNEHSSRSHCVLTVYVSASHRTLKTKINGKLHLIDLAGSERVKNSGVEGDRMKEAQAINTSLTHLKSVIQGLAQKSKHVPFRNSVLTQLLQDSLGGNCKCLMFANVSCLANNLAETICTLKYAAEARKVELGKASANVKKA